MALSASGASSDPSKYQKVPRLIQDRFAWLQRIGFCALLIFAVILLGGDTLLLRTKTLRKADLNAKADVAHIGKMGYVLGKRERTTKGESDATAPTEAMPDDAPGAESRGKDIDGDWDVKPPVREPASHAKEDDNMEPEENTDSEGPIREVKDEGEDVRAAGLKRSATKGQGKRSPTQPAPQIDDPQPPAEGEAEAEAGAKEEQEEEEEHVDWSPASPDSCEGFFGNGFSDSNTLIPPSRETGREALLKCVRHPTTTAVACYGRNMILRADRLTMSKGGEDLSAVMGRREEDETPVFRPGVSEFVTGGYSTLPVDPSAAFLAGEEEGGVSFASALPAELMGHMNRADKYKANHITSSVTVDAGVHPRTCAVRVREPVVLLTRMEYANLFHTSTDWYNVWTAMRLAGLAPTRKVKGGKVQKLTPDSVLAPSDGSPRFPAHVVFIDGHNAGPMDDGWTALFLSVSYAKHFTGPACFDRIIYAPFGYNAAISMGIQPKQTKCPASPHVRQFGNDFVRGLGLAPRAVSACVDSDGATPVLFVRRVHYLAHPRHNGQIVRRLDNEDEIVTALEAKAGQANLHMLNGLFSAMSMKEQVQAALDSCVIVGAHGAGLTHILFAPPGVHMLELQPPAFQRPHFIAYSTWSGARHHLWALGSSTPPVSEVVNRVVQIAQGAVVEQTDAVERREGHSTP